MTQPIDIAFSGPMLPYSQLAREISQHYNLSVTPEKAEYFYSKYKQAVIAELLMGIKQQDLAQQRLEIIPIAWDRVRRATGQIGSAGNQQYIADFFLAKEYLLRSVSKGNNIKSRKSEMSLTAPLEFLLQTANDEEICESLIHQKLDDGKKIGEYWLDPAAVDLCTVDINSLDAYLKDNRIRYTDPKTRANYRDTLQMNYLRGRELLAVARCNDGVVPQIINESKFGRRYYLGTSLQSVSKELRHAALGRCYQYDIKTAVYAWKLDTANEIVKEYGSDLKFANTLEYIDQRDYHRTRLAKLLQPMMGVASLEAVRDYVKQAFTAIGFGAKANTNGWWVNDQYQRPALSSIIRNPEALELFLKDPFVAGFLEEQTDMNKIIFEYSREDLKDLEFLKGKNNALNQNRVMAFLYQSAERQWIETVKSELRRWQPANQILLTVHDGFYTVGRAPLADMRFILNELCPFAKIEVTEHQSWRDPEQHEEQLQFEDQHRQFIEDEEAHAGRVLGSLTKLKPKYTAPAVATTQEGCYDGSGYTGDNYNNEDDPWYQELTPEEQREVDLNRKKILYLKDSVDSSMPDWVSRIITQKTNKQ